MNVLITFRHGFGDAVQLTIVLKHLQKYRPDWNVDVAALVGKHSAYHGLCRNVYLLERDAVPCCDYAQRFNLDWPECHTAYADSPSTKAERTLREDFGIIPDPALCTYSIRVSDAARELARDYLERICVSKSPIRNPQSENRFPVVLIHYEGNTSADMKNIPTDVVRRLCEDIIEEGFVPVILDWDYRTPLADGVRIHCPDQRAELWHATGTGDAESLAALTELSSLMIGVDSGPLHVAGATSTPTLGVWTRHHPLHYFSHAENVTHLVPRHHADMIRGDRASGNAYFAARYHFHLYDDLESGLRPAVRSRLQAPTDPLIFNRNFWVRADMAEQDLLIVKDIAEDDSYGIDQMPMPRPVVVDVGAHIGTFSKRLHERNPLARIFAVECCPENIAALEKNVGEFATVVKGALTYEPDAALLNAVYVNCHSTGGSTVISRDELEQRVTAAIAGSPHLPLAEGRTSVRSVEPGEVGAMDECVGRDESTVRLGQYWADFRPMPTLNLEDLMLQHGFDFIDILKLDCEGSEFSILGKTPSRDRIGLIVGEFHGKEKFEQLVADRFAGWEFRILRDADIGTFWLVNPRSHAPRGNEPADARRRADTNGRPPERAVASEVVRVSTNGQTTFKDLLARLRAAAAQSDRIVVEQCHVGTASRQACDTFTSEHPEFARRFTDNGQAGSLVLERQNK